ncbi:hypothetical protein JVT61DRAFT_3442 [Boletus reticuloceps]|uniref:Distal membrane-arm assembly complex protein 1-like domain-containing protein n=1 Tax=Boletus reticuloceps TaxID=495285 RepID=A0A8I2YME3_9AGAM|nr:hypothetical protein JVT61DRAFT_3442 [Boletus reticuloceps]
MSGPPRASKSASPSTLSSEEGQQWEYKDCISCKVVGTGALALTGLYALRMARSQAPGSVFGKRMMAGIGVGESALQSRCILPRGNPKRFESCHTGK